jgi:uncharacterized protein (TIGR02186 family)
MKRGRIFGYLLITLTVTASLLAMLAGPASAELTVTANHDHINIDFFYHGSSVSVRGTADPGTDLVIKISAPEGHHVLRQKGKVGGLLWMNVATLKFDRVPSLYFLTSTKKLEDILSNEAMEKDVLGYPALAKHIDLAPVADEGEKSRWVGEFVKYKETSKLFSVTSGKITTSEKEGKQNYYVLLDWPYQAQPGDYYVTVYEVRDGKVIDQAQTKVAVQQVGVVKKLATMAKNSGALYGILSILAALGAGFGVGMIFRKGGGAH